MTKPIRHLSELDSKIYLLVALAYTGLLSFLSLTSTENFPLVEVTYSDKIGHVLAYFVFTILWFIAFFRFNLKRSLLAACAIAVAFGVLMEVLQGSLSEIRTPDLFDIIANSVGTALAVAVVFLLKKRVKN